MKCFGNVAKVFGGLLLVSIFCAAGYYVRHKKAQTSTAQEETDKKPGSRLGVVKQREVSTNQTQKAEVSSTGKVTKVMLLGTNKVSVVVEKTAPTEDQRKAVEMRELLDSGKEKESLQLARSLVSSPDPDVRARVVTALGWIGAKALPELTLMLADENELVANEALTQWKMALDELSDEPTRADMLVTAINAMKNADDMESLALSFSLLPNDLAIRSLVQLIQGGNSMAAEVGREQYSFMTQTEYTTPEAAEMWIRQNVEQPNQPAIVQP